MVLKYSGCFSVVQWQTLISPAGDLERLQGVMCIRQG
jgi:hypothetical protein